MPFTKYNNTLTTIQSKSNRVDLVTYDNIITRSTWRMFPNASFTLKKKTHTFSAHKYFLIHSHLSLSIPLIYTKLLLPNFPFINLLIHKISLVYPL